MRPILDIKPGDTLTCHETGKQFIAAREGMSTNYARDWNGNVYSDEGVDLREKKNLLDRSQPFGCYLSSDGKTVGGWKGNVLGQVTWSKQSRGRTWSSFTYVRVTDVHGGLWYGKNGGAGMCITLYPKKGAALPTKPDV